MPKKFAVVVTNLTTFKHEHLHILNLPSVGEDGFYRQTGSFNAFFYSTKNRNKNDGRQYYAKHWDEFESECQRMEKWLAKDGITKLKFDDRKLPTTEHQSIWEFYEAIGFDQKSKRWQVKCPDCNGTGRHECVAYYYGVAECSTCDASGYVLGNSRKRSKRRSL